MIVGLVIMGWLAGGALFIMGWQAICSRHFKDEVLEDGLAVTGFLFAWPIILAMVIVACIIYPFWLLAKRWT